MVGQAAHRPGGRSRRVRLREPAIPTGLRHPSVPSSSIYGKPATAPADRRTTAVVACLEHIHQQTTDRQGRDASMDIVFLTPRSSQSVNYRTGANQPNSHYPTTGPAIKMATRDAILQ